MSRTAEAVIIGGGVNGCSIAYHLARSGMKDVVLVEKGRVASGPTGRSSGIVRQHYSIRTLAEMARDSLKVFQTFEERVGGDSGFTQSGVVFACGERDAAALKTTVAMHQSLGIRAELLDSQQLRELEPEIMLGDITLAAYEPDAGFADPTLTASSFCAAAETLGVETLWRTEVTGIRTDRNAVTAVETDQGEISTRVVINVGGPWANRVAAMAGIHFPMHATRHPVVILQRPAGWRTPTPVWLDIASGWYHKPERNPATLMVGSMQVGGADDAVDRDHYATLPTIEEAERYAQAACDRFPVLADVAVQGGWAGIYDVTPDGQPVLDRIAEVEGLYFAAGFSGHGFKLAPAIGIAITQLVTNGCSTAYDLSPFRFDRFREGRLTRSAYEYSIVG